MGVHGPGECRAVRCGAAPARSRRRPAAPGGPARHGAGIASAGRGRARPLPIRRGVSRGGPRAGHSGCRYRRRPYRSPRPPCPSHPPASPCPTPRPRCRRSGSNRPARRRAPPRTGGRGRRRFGTTASRPTRDHPGGLRRPGRPPVVGQAALDEADPPVHLVLTTDARPPRRPGPPGRHRPRRRPGTRRRPTGRLDRSWAVVDSSSARPFGGPSRPRSERPNTSGQQTPRPRRRTGDLARLPVPRGLLGIIAP